MQFARTKIHSLVAYCTESMGEDRAGEWREYGEMREGGMGGEGGTVGSNKRLLFRFFWDAD